MSSQSLYRVLFCVPTPVVCNAIQGRGRDDAAEDAVSTIVAVVVDHDQENIGRAKDEAKVSNVNVSFHRYASFLLVRVSIGFVCCERHD